MPNSYLGLKHAQNLLEITDGCRADMHEPDNNGVSATVEGDHIDNAFGDAGMCGEMVVVITKEQDHGDSYKVKFNLATLIALARVGAAKELQAEQI